MQKFLESSTELALCTASSVSEGLAICTTFARDLKNKCYPHIQKSSSSNPALFVPESTFPRMIT